jgi:hypothetical protein
MSWAHAGMCLFALVILLEQAHLASPIVLAWTHKGLRQIMGKRLIESVVFPAVAFLFAILSPFWLVQWSYWTWNIYHFGTQNYGLLALSGRRGRFAKVICLSATAFCMAGLPWLIPSDLTVFWVSLFAIDFPHWISDIWLSALVSRQRWVFVAALCLIGCVGFLFKVPRVDHIATLAIPWIIQARWGAGMIHFIYSARIWKLSDPQVRAIIGKHICRLESGSLR